MAGERVRVSVLGPLELTGGTGRPVRVGGQRVRALLILLALDPGRVQPAASIIERLWPGDQPADAANALQSLVSRLRVALREGGVPARVIESSPAGYRLAVPSAAVDAVAFAAQAADGARALARGDAVAAASLLHTALSGWRGAPLADVAAEEFALAPAARLTELRAAALLDRIEADLALGGPDAALVGELRALVAADPLAERPAALLMRALAAAGRQADALAVYARVREQLAGDLGVSPSPGLEQVYLGILRQEIPQADPAGQAPAAGNEDPPAGAPPAVRRPPTSFVGRHDDLARVLKRLAAERLITLTGPGGVGKTRLAAETAASLTVPAWLAELAPVTDPAQVAAAVLDTLGLRERSIARRGAEVAGDQLDRLAGALADRDAVLILDNCEHVVDAAAALAARLLSDCPRLRVLATSREPLRIAGEALHVVSPLAAPPGPAPARPSPPRPGLPGIAAFPAVRLFADRASAVVGGFELTEANAGAVAGICRDLDGMPLAIELAAPWLRTLTPDQLAGRLADRFALLTGGSRTALPRHQTLRAAVAWSWDLLSGPEQAVARRLAVFPVGATLDAAERVAGADVGAGPAGAPAGVLPALAGLVGKSILTRSEGGPDGEPRYRMLETVRAYGLERLAEAGEDEATRDVFARYFLDFAEDADPRLRSRTQARWFRALAAEQDNLNAAIRWAAARGDAETALRLVRALGYFWVQRGHGEADALAAEVLALPLPAPLTAPVIEGRICCALLAAGWNWDIASIRAPLDEAIAALEPFGGTRASLHPLVSMAEPLLMQFDGALDEAEQQYKGHINARDPWLRAMGRVYLSASGFSLGRLNGAEEQCRTALAELRAMGEQWGVAVALAHLAEFTELRAEHAESATALAESAAIGRELGVWGDLTYVEMRLVLVRARAGDSARAREGDARVQRVIEGRGALVDTDRWVAFMRAELAWREGDYAGAARHCEAVLATIPSDLARWWDALRAQALARLAMARLAVARLTTTRLADGDLAVGRALLAGALDGAESWCEHPALAAVLDACAAFVAERDGAGDAERAAWLLGAAHGIRGAVDASSLDAPAARDRARRALGSDAFDAAYVAARGATYTAAIAGARQALAG